MSSSAERDPGRARRRSAAWRGPRCVFLDGGGSSGWCWSLATTSPSPNRSRIVDRVRDVRRRRRRSSSAAIRRNTIGLLFLYASFVTALLVPGRRGHHVGRDRRSDRVVVGVRSPSSATSVGCSGSCRTSSSLPLLFPDGRLPSARWRPFLWFIVAFLVFIGIDLTLGQRTLTGSTDAVGIANPLFVEAVGSLPTLDSLDRRPVPGHLRRVGRVAGPPVPPFGGRRAAADQVGRVRIRVGARRHPLDQLLGRRATHPHRGGRGGGAFLLLPVSIGIAVLRFHLYDLDVVVRKAVVYAAFAVFATLVYLARRGRAPASWLGRDNSFLTMVAAVVVAVTFQPVRARLTRFANRARLREARDAVRGAVRVLRTGRRRVRGRGRPPSDGARPRRGRRRRTCRRLARGRSRSSATSRRGPTAPTGTCADPAPERVGAADRRHGPRVPGRAGRRAARRARGPQADERPRDTRRREADRRPRGAGGARAAQRSALRGAQGAAGRAAGGAEATGLGAGRRSAAGSSGTSTTARSSSSSRSPSSSARRRARSTGPAEGASDARRSSRPRRTTALEDLRDLARGIYPPLLADKGLAAALEAQARKSGAPGRGRADGVGRYPQDVEAAVYFSCLEALQNVAKYADASSVDVRIGSSETASLALRGHRRRRGVRPGRDR